MWHLTFHYVNVHIFSYQFLYMKLKFFEIRMPIEAIRIRP